MLGMKSGRTRTQTVVNQRPFTAVTQYGDSKLDARFCAESLDGDRYEWTFTHWSGSSSFVELPDGSLIAIEDLESEELEP